MFLRIFYEPAEFIGNIGLDWSLNILEEGWLGAKDWVLAAGNKVSVLGHLLGGAAGLRVGVFKGMGEGIIYSFPAVIEKPAIIE